MIDRKPVLDDLNLDSDHTIAILADFLEGWECAPEPDRGAILQTHCDQHPKLAEEIRNLVAGWRVVRDSSDPEHLGSYRITRVLAIGGMGKVYEAQDEELRRTVAVKTIRLGRSANPKLLEHFEYERLALARLHHTHIVPIYSAGEDNGLLYFAMPLIKGLSLADLVATISCWPPTASTSEPPPTWEKILGKATTDATWRRSVRRIGANPEGAGSLSRFVQSGPERTAPTAARPALTVDYFRHVAEVLAVAAEALHSAHESGVLHFDVKPSNILIERVTGKTDAIAHPWLIDFGLADTSGAEAGDSPPGESVNSPGTRPFGTKGFMAPEVLMLRDTSGTAAHARGDDRLPLGRQTDIWSLGVTLYQLLTLHMPFADDRDVLDPEVKPHSLREYVPGLPCELEAVVLKALEKPLAARYPTAAAFAGDLRRWLGGCPTIAGKASPPKRLVMWARRRPAAAFAAGMTAALAIVTLLGAGQAVRVSQAQAETARAQTAEALAIAGAAERDAQAKQRELNLITVSRLRAPIRTAGWSNVAWLKTRELAAGRTDADGRLQGQFAALLDGLDLHPYRSYKQAADILAFDHHGERLLMGRRKRDARGRTATRLVMGDLAGQQRLTEKSFASNGVVGFRGSAAMVLERDVSDASLLRLRDAITGNEKLLLKSARNGASSVIAHTLSRDGSRAAGVVWPLRKRTPAELAASADKTDIMTEDGDVATLIVWDIASSRVIRSIADKQAPTHEVVLSPDGSLLATWDTTGKRHEVAVWSVGDGALAGRFPSNRLAISSVAFGRDPTCRDDAQDASWRLAVGEGGGKVTVWDLYSRSVRCITRGSSHDVSTLDFSPDGTLLASAGRDFFMIWDVSSGQCVLKMWAGTYQSAVAFSRDGRRLALAKTSAFGSPDEVEVYELEEGRGLRTLRGLTQRIEKIAVSANGGRVAALSNDWEVGIFDARSGKLIGAALAPEGSFTDNAALALNADGSRVVLSAGTEAKLWEVETERLRLLRKWELSPALTEAAGFHPDGRLLLVRQETKGGKLGPFYEANPDDHPRVCRAYELPEQGDKKRLAEIPDFDRYVEHIAATPDAAYFAVQGTTTGTGKPARILHLYDGSTGKQVGSIHTGVPPGNSATGMRFDPKGTRLHVQIDAGNAGRHEIFEVPSLKSMGAASAVNGVNVGASRWVTNLPQTSDATDTIVLSEQNRPAPLLRVVRDLEVTGAEGIKFSPDGLYIAWGNQDGTVTICDLNEVQRRLAGVGLAWE